MFWKEKLVLQDGEITKVVNEIQKGNLGQREIKQIQILNAADQVVGNAVFEEHTEIKSPFRTTYHLRQTSTNGAVIVDERWE